MEPRYVELQPGSSMFEPAYASFSDFPIPVDSGSESTVDVAVEPEMPPGGVYPTPLPATSWGFITVTNNETRQITTITPD